VTHRAAPVSLGALARVAFVAGLLGFGGGFAVIARLKRDMVEVRAWMAPEAFTELVGVAGALPGTIVTGLLVLVGQRLRGTAGALVASVVFLAPGVALMCAIAAFYDRIHGAALARAILDGLNPAVAGLFASVAVDLGKDTLKSKRAWAVAGFALLALVFRWLTLLEVVIVAGVIGVIVARPPRNDRGAAGSFFFFSSLASGAGASIALALFGVFARIGVATFGGGIAMVPAMEHEALSRGWLDAQTFADAVALGQITPGPLMVVATFVGWRVGGPLGALGATLGVFVPPAILTLVAARSLEAFKESRALQGFLRGVGPAVVGLVAAAAIAVGRASVHGPFDVAVLVAAAAVRVARPRTSPLWPLAAGAMIGVARAFWAGAPVL
jgi:chromate transporter